MAETKKTLEDALKALKVTIPVQAPEKDKEPIKIEIKPQSSNPKPEEKKQGA